MGESPAEKLERRQAVTAFFGERRLRELFDEHRFLLIDGGAKGGIPDEWYPVLPLLEVFAFEPLWREGDHELQASLDIGDSFDFSPTDVVRKTKIFPSVSSLFRTALGSECGTRTFHVTNGPSMSSFLRADGERWELYGLDVEATELRDSFEVETTTLDAVVEERGVRFVDFIKLDTQGSELEILAGGTKTIGELAFGLRVETSFVSLYKGQPLFGEIDAHLRARGFEFIDFAHFKRLPRVGRGGRDRERPKKLGFGQMIQADPLYFRAPSAAVARMETLGEADRERYLAGALVACLTYSRLDYAVELLALAEPLLGDRAARTLRDVVHAYPGVRR